MFLPSEKVRVVVYKLKEKGLMQNQKVKILVAGTDMVGMSNYVKILQLEKYDVCTAFNGEDLLEVLERENFDFDLLITQIRIPGLKSYDLADYIAMHSPQIIPIIGIAELPRDEELVLNTGESYAVVMIRGFTLEEFVTSVESVLESHEDLLTDDILKRAALLTREKAEESKLKYRLCSADHNLIDKAHQDFIDKFKEM